MQKTPRTFDDVAECVESTLSRVGPRIVLALPLGIGKPNPLANEFYRRARRDPAVKLKIFTALSLRTPEWHGELERRFVQPLVERTEYGVADLRGRTDQEVIAAMLNITESRFQDGLKREAQRAGKLAPDYRIPEIHRNNSRQALEERFALARARGLFSDFPFGTDLTREEIALAEALAALRDRSAKGLSKMRGVLSAALSRGTPAALRPYLERMDLVAPTTREEWLWQRLLVQELKALGSV